MILLKGAVWL